LWDGKLTESKFDRRLPVFVAISPGILELLNGHVNAFWVGFGACILIFEIGQILKRRREKKPLTSDLHA
jgi:hypothetical protein